MEPETAMIIENMLLSILVIGITIIVSWILSQIAFSRLLNVIGKGKAKWVSRTIQYGIMIAGLYIVIYQVLNLDLRAFAASLGIIGIAVAFSSQQVIQNIIAGVLITIRRPIQLEDWIEVAGTGVCRVRDIGLLQTEIRGINGRLIFVPNSVLLNSMITNYTKAGASLITIPMMLPQSTDYDDVKELLLVVAREIIPTVELRQRTRHRIIQRIIPHFAALIETKKTVKSFEPQVIITDLSNGRLTINMRIWTENIERRDDIISMFLEKAMREAKRKGIVLMT
ncbi:MAG: mechanosensitive ion channel family protein [Candidatus Woesearchaeota archaeon]